MFTFLTDDERWLHGDKLLVPSFRVTLSRDCGPAAGAVPTLTPPLVYCDLRRVVAIAVSLDKAV